MVQEKLINETAVAEWLNVHVATIRKLRTQKKTLPYVKIGERVLYRPADIEAYITANTVQVTK